MADLCPRCKASPPPYDALRSWGVFSGPLREAIHQLKYQKNIAMGDSLAPHLLDVLKSTHWQIDLISPVPLSQGRLLERGYNQSAQLARPLALAMGLPYKPAALRKIRETRPQVGLNAREREQNIQGSFAADPKLVNNRSLLVIDDVTTTGSTIAACADAARRAGASHVYGLTLTRPVINPDDNPSQGA
jgi:competence protein ComFC